MGQIRKLDKEGMRSRIDKKNLSGSSWTCFKMADQTLTEIDGIVSNCSVGGITIPRYESLADSIGKLEADSKLLLDYPDELIEGIDAVDSDFSHNVNNALNALSAIKLDDIRVKNTFDVEVTSVFNIHDHTGDPLNSPKPDLTIADFIGYFDEYALGRDTSFVKGFTDVLYLEDIREGKSLQDILKEDNDSLKELLYGSEIDIKKYAPNAQYMSEIAGDIPGGIYPLATAIYGYDIFTHDRLTKKERKNEGITGTVELVLLLLLWGKADGLVEGVTPYLSMAGSNVAQTGAEHLCEDMGAPPLATLLISSTVGALAFVGGEVAGMKSAEIINSQRGVFKGIDKNASFSEAKKLAGECRTSHGESSENGGSDTRINGTSYNAKKLKQTQPYVYDNEVDQLVELIKEKGPNAVPPIQVRVHDGVAYIVDGHHRYNAFVKLGYERVPIKYLHSSDLGKILFDGTYIRSLDEILDGASLVGD